MPATARRPRSLVLHAALAVLVAACGEDVVLPPPTSAILDQQIVLYALSGTDVRTPSGYTLLGLIEVRTDQSSEFDFAFDIGLDSAFGLGTSGDTVAVLLPRGALGFSPDGGLQHSTLPFDSIVRAPLEGYEEQRAVRINTGDVLLAASRRQQCTFAVIRPRVAKLDVIDVDFSLRRATIRLAINPNCGYLSLAPGFPTE